MTTKNTSENVSFKELVEIDKRSILEKVLEMNFPTTKPKNDSPASSNEKNESTSGISDYDVIFGEDIDDIDELFEDILKKAREDFKKQENLKKKYPDLSPIKDIFKKPPPKNRRKRGMTKTVENTLAVINNFKKRMMDSSKQMCRSTTNLSNNNNNQLISRIVSPNDDYNQISSLIIPSARKDYNQFKSSIKTLIQGNQYNKIAYPAWKTTGNYTPAFSATTNPNWVNIHSNSTRTKVKKLCTLAPNKYYTPGHISSWMDAATHSNPTEPPSCKSIRSNIAVHDSDSGEDSIQSIDNTSIYFSPEYKNLTNKNSSVGWKTSLKNTISSNAQMLKNTMDSNVPKNKNTISSPMKSTTVRFRPSPPQYFVYGSDKKSSISLDSTFVKENENSSQVNSLENFNEIYRNSNENSVPLQNSKLSLQTQYSPWKENIEYEEHHRIFSSKKLHDNIQKNILNETTMNNKPAMLVEDFVRKLNYNISNNYNMKMKCSMKVEYYK